MVATPDDGESRPDQDPSRLTNEAVDRATAAFDEKLKARQELLEAEIKAVHGVIHERFDSIDGQFVMIEDRRKEQKADTAESNAKALVAQEKLINALIAAAGAATAKAEEGFLKTQEQQRATTAAEIMAVREGFEELKERLGRNENGVGRVESGREGGHQANSMALVLIGTILAAVGVVGGVIGVVAQLGQ